MISVEPHLLIDCATPQVQIGILKRGEWLAFFAQEGSALESIFGGIEECLQKASLELKDVAGFIFCEGPGGTLGLRLASTVLRSWRVFEPWSKVPIYSYTSLELAAACLEQCREDCKQGDRAMLQKPYLIASEIGADKWAILERNDDEEGESQNISAVQVYKQMQVEAFSGNKWGIQQRKSWNLWPKQMAIFEYSSKLQACPKVFSHFKGLRRVEQPNLLTLEETSFKKWSGKPHLA